MVLVRVSASFASLSWVLLSSPGRGSSSRTVGLQASRCCCGDGGVAFPSAEALGFRRRACAYPLDVFVSLEIVAFFLFFAQSSSPGGGREMSESTDCFEPVVAPPSVLICGVFFLLYKKLRFLNSLVFCFFFPVILHAEFLASKKIKWCSLLTFDTVVSLPEVEGFRVLGCGNAGLFFLRNC